jgi:hypothetical protein
VHIPESAMLLPGGRVVALCNTMLLKICFTFAVIYGIEPQSRNAARHAVRIHGGIGDSLLKNGSFQRMENGWICWIS